jgi:uncharacterized protein YqjF (DUF2071 family)
MDRGQRPSQSRKDGRRVVGRTADQRVSVPALEAAWLTLTFVHWPVPTPAVQALLPPGLAVDEWRGSAWVSLTPFVMADMLPLGLGFPAAASRRAGPIARVLHEVSSSPETNLRTYVRGPDGRDGIWFFSLDIGARTLAVALRCLAGAPYRYGRLSVEPIHDAVTYAGSRPGGESLYHAVVRPGDALESSELDTWLTGRWRAYTTHLGRLLVFPVEHEPWPLRSARLDTLEEHLTDRAGLPELGEASLVHYSEGVRRVRLGLPRLVARSARS